MTRGRRIFITADGPPSGICTEQDEERALNRGLQQRHVNLAFSSTAVRSIRPCHLLGIVSAANSKTPPTDRPLVRFIGADDPDDKVALVQPWLAYFPG